MTRKTMAGLLAVSVACLMVGAAAALGGTVTKHPGPWHALHVYGVYPGHLSNNGWTLTDASCFDATGAKNDQGHGDWDGRRCTVEFVAPDFAPAPSSSFMCQSADARENPSVVLDSEILSDDPGTRSLANGWHPASFIGGAFSCAPVSNPTVWTDDSLSIYDAPNTKYANPVAS